MGRVFEAQILVALYLSGGPGTGLSVPSHRRTRGWPDVLRALRSEMHPSSDIRESARKVLLAQNFWEEASILRHEERWDWAEALVEQKRCLTAVDSAYPALLKNRFGPTAPAAFWSWRQGDDTAELSAPLSQPARDWVAIVGPRQTDASTLRFARLAGQAAAQLGYGVISGGALGVDREAVLGCLDAGGFACEMLCHGIDVGAQFAVRDAFYAPLGGYRTEHAGRLSRLTVHAPLQTFTPAAARMRNPLVYASAHSALVLAPRFKEGGTWHGAIEALRRKLCPILVSSGQFSALSQLLSAMMRGDNSGVNALGKQSGQSFEAFSFEGLEAIEPDFGSGNDHEIHEKSHEYRALSSGAHVHQIAPSSELALRALCNLGAIAFEPGSQLQYLYKQATGNVRAKQELLGEHGMFDKHERRKCLNFTGLEKSSFHYDKHHEAGVVGVAGVTWVTCVNCVNEGTGVNDWPIAKAEKDANVVNVADYREHRSQSAIDNSLDTESDADIYCHFRDALACCILQATEGNSGLQSKLFETEIAHCL